MVKAKRVKKSVVLLALIIAAVALFSGFVRYDGIGNVYYSTNMEIFDKVNYSKILGGHDNNGVERAYTVTADTQNSIIEPVVYSGEIRSKATLTTMISGLEAQGYKVVAGINGDIYSTDTGCPQGIVINEGRILSSGYQSQYAISFDANGRAELAFPNINYGLSTSIAVPREDGTYVNEQYNANIGYFNVPHGAGNALHLYNRHYASTTKTSGNCIEVVLDAGSVDNAQLRVGGTISATVVETRINASNTPIGDNQLVLSTKSEADSAWALKCMAPGNVVNIVVSDLDGGPLSYSKECIGMYYLLYANGKYETGGTNLNPRTCIGIKADGSVMLYVLDGRQSGISGGLGLTDVAKHMVSLGCVVVANMDGGGSSAMVVREPGVDDKAVLKNSPSGGSQRAVTNGLFFVYKNSAQSNGSNISTYPAGNLAMPGADVQLSTYASNGLFEKGGNVGNLSYEVLSGSGSVNANGLFTAASSTGKSKVQITNGNATTTTEIDVYDGITFTPSVTNIVTEPSSTVDINVTPRYGYAPIAGKDSLFTWTCDPKIGTIDANGVFTATSLSSASGNITVSYNGATHTIPVQVGSKYMFGDIAGHWAKDYIEALASEGIVNGMGDNLFGPDSPLTRAQFLAMLAKSVPNLEISKSTPAGFTDVPQSEWYYNYVNWGFETGIVKGFDGNVFLPNAQITREQMTVMLDQFATAMSITLPANATGAFTDEAKIGDWSIASVNRIVAAGIMNGQPDGRFDPQGNATRGQAAKVVYILCEIRDGRM